MQLCVDVGSVPYLHEEPKKWYWYDVRMIRWFLRAFIRPTGASGEEINYGIRVVWSFPGLGVACM